MSKKEESKILDDELDKLMDHDYDGIRELDNRLPPWWVKLFYITIIWSVGYMFYYHFLGIGDLSQAEYMKEMNLNYSREKDQTYRPLLLVETYHSPYYNPKGDITPKLLAEAQGLELFTAPPVQEEEELNYEPLTDAESLQRGKQIYLQNCVKCHGVAGEGGIGPNLTDDYWIHGEGDINSIIRIIRNGVPVKGMIAWKSYLRPQQIHEVGSYVYSLRGTNPPNAKEPQGRKVTGD